MSKILTEVRDKYSTFSGADIVIMMGGFEIGAATSFLVNVTRDKKPQYVMGDPDPKAYTRGSRIVSGKMDGLILHEDAFWAAMQQLADQPGFNIYRAAAASFVEHRKSTYDELPLNETKIADIMQMAEYKPVTLDEMPPVDIVVVGVNEFGAAGKTEVIGVEFDSTNVAFTVQNEAAQNSVNYVARAYVPWKPIKTQMS